MAELLKPGSEQPATAVNEALRVQIVGMADRDLAYRARLAAEGKLGTGYADEMRRIHEENADRLAEIIRQRGWPGPELVGQDGSNAAWLVVQHAISRPAFLRSCLTLLKTSQGTGVNAAQLAMLEDRIRNMEGRPQSFGTQFDWDDNAELSPVEIEDRGGVEQRRREAGLDPLQENIARIRRQARLDGLHPPASLSAHRAGQEAFARAVGWRGRSSHDE